MNLKSQKCQISQKKIINFQKVQTQAATKKFNVVLKTHFFLMFFVFLIFSKTVLDKVALLFRF